MAELVTDCPRCGSKRVTFDVLAAVVLWTEYGWKQTYEGFGHCRHCGRTTIFKLSDQELDSRDVVNAKGMAAVPGSLAGIVSVESFVSQKDLRGAVPPEYLPEDIESAFKEGATCVAVGCYNAAGAMFRLCVDHATRALLPADDREGLNSRTRRSLGLRMQWLFDHSLLPVALQELSTCIREDGNDGAHSGSLTKADADDLQDFTTILLDRLYTERGKLAAAAGRRQQRRGKAD